MQHIIELFKKLFDELEWNYDFDDKRFIFATGLDMNNAIGKLKIVVYIKEKSYTVYAILNNHVEAQFMTQVSEYLHRANYCLHNGNFEIDYTDGEIRYKTYVNYENTQVSSEIVEHSLLVPIFMFDTYGKNLIKLLVDNEDPKKLIDEVESSTNE